MALALYKSDSISSFSRQSKKPHLQGKPKLNLILGQGQGSKNPDQQRRRTHLRLISASDGPEDPIWATNLYWYTDANPINFIDPYGLKKSYAQCYRESVLNYYGADFYTIFRSINSLLTFPIRYPRGGVDSSKAIGVTSVLSYIQHLSNWAKNPRVKNAANKIVKIVGKRGLRTAGRLNAAGFFFFTSYDLKQIHSMARKCFEEANRKKNECFVPDIPNFPGGSIPLPPGLQPK